MERNLNKLRAHSRQLIEFSRSIGLKIKQIFLTKRNENDFDDSIKIFVIFTGILSILNCESDFANLGKFRNGHETLGYVQRPWGNV